MLVSRQGDRDFVKVLDFGLAKVAPETLADDGKAAEQALTKHGTIFGTPKYMAPEQCVCQPVDGRTDLYALGWVLFEMLAGTHPFSAKDVLTIVRHQLSTPTPTIASVAPSVQVPKALEAVVQHLTDKRPEHRFPNAAAALAALAAVEDQPEHADLPGQADRQGGLASKGDSEAAGTLASVELVSVMDVGAKQATPAAVAAASAAPKTKTDPPATAVAAVPAAPAVATAVTPLSLPPSVRAAAARGGDAVPALIARLPPAFQKRPALLLGLLGLAGLGLIWLLHSPSPSETRTAAGRPVAGKSMPPAAQAPKGQLEQAIASGEPEQLISLAKAFPGDARVKRSVAHTYMAQHNGFEALRWLAKATALDGSLVQEGEISQAAKLAFTHAELVDDAITFLEGEFGETGVDVLLDLAVRPGPLRLKLKFNQSIAKPEVRKHASRAAQVAMELRAAGKCEQKRTLLPRASQYGDRRVLQQLQWLEQKQNCGPYGLGDCGACLRQDGALHNAIAAITARIGPDN